MEQSKFIELVAFGNQLNTELAGKASVLDVKKVRDEVNTQLEEIKYLDAIDCRVFGIKADGVTDDSNAFEKAINTCSKLKRRLKITGNKIRITRPILIDAGVNINLIGIPSSRGGKVAIWLDIAGENGTLFRGNTSSGRIPSKGELYGIRFETYKDAYGRSKHTFMKDIAFRESFIKQCEINSFKYIFDNVSLGYLTELIYNQFREIGKAVFTGNSILGDVRILNNYFSGNSTYKPNSSTNVVRLPDFIDLNSPSSTFSLSQINDNWFEKFTSVLNGATSCTIQGNVFDYCFSSIQAKTDNTISGNVFSHVTKQEIIDHIQSWAGNISDEYYNNPTSLISLNVRGNTVQGNSCVSSLVSGSQTYFVKFLGGTGNQVGMVTNTKINGNSFAGISREMLIDFSSVDFTGTVANLDSNQFDNCNFGDLDSMSLTSIPSPESKNYIKNSRVITSGLELLGVKKPKSTLHPNTSYQYHLADKDGHLHCFKTENLIKNFNETGWNIGGSNVISPDGLNVTITHSKTGWKNTTFRVNNIEPEGYYRVNFDKVITENGSTVEIWLYDKSNKKLNTYYLNSTEEMICKMPSNISYFVVYIRKKVTTANVPYTIGMITINPYSTKPTRTIINSPKYRFAQYFDGTTMKYEPYI